jgi:hypothetical protein
MTDLSTSRVLHFLVGETEMKTNMSDMSLNTRVTNYTKKDMFQKEFVVDQW